MINDTQFESTSNIATAAAAAAASLLLPLISLCSDSRESATILANDDFKDRHKTDGMGSTSLF